MPQGGSGRDGRDTFHIDRLRFIVRADDPKAAPEKKTCEVYVKNNVLFSICENGTVQPLNATGVSASPGFTWGRGGTLAITGYTVGSNDQQGEYLLNDEVPSNQSGRFVVFTAPQIRKVLITTSAVTTCTFIIQEHDGGSGFTDLTSVSLTGEKQKVVDLTTPVTSGKQLAVKLSSGSCTNPVVGVILDGLY